MTRRTLGLRQICDLRECFGLKKNRDVEESETTDRSASGLSHVGKAAYGALKLKHAFFHHKLWNVTYGKVVGKLQHTPRDAWTRDNGDVKSGHDDWFPEQMGEIIGRTEVWCDVLSLAPPDGLFMVEFNKALQKLAKKSLDEDKVIVVRMMFGNLPAQPVNCDAIIRELTAGIANDDSTNLRLWVGAWIKGVSWNHAKIIAVDGHFLHTGGHNLWDPHYLKKDPVHDLSVEMEGGVARDGHRYAEAQWDFIRKRQHTVVGWFVDKLPDKLPMIAQTRVTVSEFPMNVATEFPERFDFDLIPERSFLKDAVPMITIGRYGTINWKARPSDDAILAMINSSKKSIRMALQDLGPVCIPKTKIPLPGLGWPEKYMTALARAIWLRNVDVEIVLSHPNSIPGGLSFTEANYGNGWSCVDVAAQIIRNLKEIFGADDIRLRKKVEDNLRVCFLKQKIGSAYSSGIKMGMHAKHFIIDDRCAYIGSQNLYVCDLAEWGVIVDHEEATRKMMDEYWCPMWEASYTVEDCSVREVMDGLNIDRGPQRKTYSFRRPNWHKKKENSEVHLDLPDSDLSTPLLIS